MRGGRGVTEGLCTLSHRELDRVGVIEGVAAGRVRQREAAEQLALSVRQVKRLVRRYCEQGAAGLVSRRRGRPSNHRLRKSLRAQALSLVRSRYADFGPTLAHEKLTEVHGLQLSVETLRQLMIEDGLWQPKRRRRRPVFQLRERRPRRGELVQIDGSPHDWFEGRGQPCTLLVFIDDATGVLGQARFAPSETTQAYMQALEDYMRAHGRPVALYSDRHSIFRLTQKECANGRTLTQFGRALKALEIEAIHAHTPQAKGRVERANKTLQDRLVKEMRLAGISDIDAANAFLPGFLADYNRRFARPPKHAEDAHRPLHHSTEELDRILCLQHTRRLSKSLSMQFQNILYHVQSRGGGYHLRGAQITVCEHVDGRITLLRQDRSLAYTTYAKGERPAPVEDEKTVNQCVDQTLARQAPPHKPKPDHPWRRYKTTATASAERPVGTSLLGTKGDICTLG
jgi:transposase